MGRTSYKVALIQLNLDGFPESNLAKCMDQVRYAAGKGAQIICLPELYSSFYFCQRESTEYFRFAESRYGKSFEAFSGLSRSIGCVIIVPFFEKRAEGIYHNSVFVTDADGSEAGFYRKMHIPDDPAYYEKFYFTPGDLGYQAFMTKYGKVGTLICWDQWYPEAARLTALKGAEILFYPTAIGWHPHEKSQYGQKQFDAWMTVQRGHAVANGVFVAAVNRVGLERPVEGTAGIEFWGSSFICGPQGEILAQASHDREEVIFADIDIGLITDVRQNWPFYRDRRTDSYGDIVKRYID